MSTQARANAVSPHELARKGGVYAGELPISSFPRLSALVLCAGNVEVQLGFELDDQGRSHVRGRAVVRVDLSCQRCLEPVTRALDAEIDLRVVTSDAVAQSFAGEFEAFVSPEDEIRVVDLIEDDLILALPSQVCEAYDACPNAPELTYPVDDGSAEQRTDERPNPFAALAELKNRRN